MEWAWLIPVFSFAAFPAIVLFGRFLPGKGAYLAILAIAAGFGVFWFVLNSFLDQGAGCGLGQGVVDCSREWFSVAGVQLTWGMIIDPISIVMLGLVTFVALMVQVYSLGYMKGEARFGWYFAAHSLFAASMLTLVLADNFLLLYVAWELVGLCSYLLIGYYYDRRSAAEAAKKAFITTRLGDVGLLIGILWLGREVGNLHGTTFDFGIHNALEAASAGAIGEGALTGIALLLFLGAMGKSAQFPFHVWLPDAMEGPSPVSALIHAATMVVAGVYLVARTFPIFEAAHPAALQTVAGVGLFTALMASTIALVSTDLKRILAYSTISHLGLMMLSLGTFGVAAAMFHLMAHGFSKALLFLGAGSVMHGADQTDIRHMGGLRRVMPITAVTFTIGALSLGGVPVFAGFWSKDEILLATLDHYNAALLVPTLIVAFLSALYMARALLVVFYGRLLPENEHAHEASPSMAVPLILLAVLATGFGFIAIDYTSSYGGLSHFFDSHHRFEFNPSLAIGGAVTALLAFLLGFMAYFWKNLSLEPWRARFGFPLKVAEAKYYVDEVYQLAIDKVILAFSGVVASFDRIAVNDIGVNGPANVLRAFGIKLRLHVTGRVYNYTLVMAVGVVFLGLLWWGLS